MALTFFWRCESSTLDGTHDYSAGDTTGADTASPTYTTPAFAGTNSLNADNFLSFVEFASSSIYSAGEGCCALAFYMPTWGGATFAAFQDDATPNNHLRISTSGASGSGGISVEVEEQLESTDTVSTGDIGLASATWYFIIVSWDEAATTIRIQTYNSSGVEIDTTTDTAVTAAAWPPSGDEFMFGDTAGDNNDLNIDNVFIGSAYTDSSDFLSNYNITSYTNYSTGGSSGIGSRINSGLIGGILINRGHIN